MHSAFSAGASAIARVIGHPIQYERGDSDFEEIDAVFSAEFQAVVSGDIKVSSRRPEIMIAMEDFREVFPDLGDPVKGDRCEVAEVMWEVVTVKPDAEGASWMISLKRP